MIEAINSLLPVIFIGFVYLVAVLADRIVQRQDERHKEQVKEFLEMMLGAMERRDVYMLAKNIAELENEGKGANFQGDLLKQVMNFHQVNKIKANQLGV